MVMLTVDTVIVYCEAYMKTVGAVGNVQYKKPKDERLSIETFIVPPGIINLTKTYPTIGRKMLQKIIQYLYIPSGMKI